MELLLRGRLDFLYSFQNEKKIFAAADHRSKQTVILATKGGSTKSFRTRFRLGVGDSPEAHEIPDDILGNDDATMTFTPDDVRANSPKTLSLVELRTQRDLDIFRKIYSRSIRIGDNALGWEITFATEFHTTNDSKHFPPREQWNAKLYKPDVFGRWVGLDGDVALPFYEGRIIGQYDFSQKGWVSGKGRKAVWRELAFDSKTIEPQFLMSQKHVMNFKDVAIPTFAYMRVGSATNTRTVIGCYVAGFPSGDSVFHLRLSKPTLEKYLCLSGCLTSLALDYSVRPRLTGLNLSWYIMEESPLPHIDIKDVPSIRIVLGTARLTLLHRRFAPEWLRLKHLYPDLTAKEWKHWWAVAEADRLRLRVEIDALCADFYGLEPDDFDWIVRDDPTDPKGFYRVDRKLPFRERLTGLSAAAFRALKEGKWSAESAAKLTNDEFFEIIGIPELTSPAAAKAKNLPEPLILKRDGCHKWEPEKFGKDDPRHGWTWKDCWNDAVTLLGSEDAVKDYIEGSKRRSAGKKRTTMARKTCTATRSP